MKVVLIGATGTIGGSIAQLLSEKEYNVLKASRYSDYAVDIENIDSINTFFSEIGEVDAVICAAGDASFGALSKLTEKQINIGIRSKLMGQVNICRKVLQTLNPNGTIILTGGILAHNPWPETTNIAMINAALEGFVKALALELTDGQRVLVVHPPLVKETAQAIGMDDSQCVPAEVVAYTYLRGLEGQENGIALYVDG